MTRKPRGRNMTLGRGGVQKGVGGHLLLELRWSACSFTTYLSPAPHPGAAGVFIPDSDMIAKQLMCFGRTHLGPGGRGFACRLLGSAGGSWEDVWGQQAP